MLLNFLVNFVHDAHTVKSNMQRWRRPIFGFRFGANHWDLPEYLGQGDVKCQLDNAPTVTETFF